MEQLLEFYPKRFTNFEGNIFELFTKFYTYDLAPIDSWLDCQLINKVTKDNEKAKQYLKEGKSYVNVKDYLSSLKSFTKCLSTATADSELYSLALDCRSRVSYEIQQFEDCLKDIDLCLRTDCSSVTISNLYLRRAECFFKTGQKLKMIDSINEGVEFFIANTDEADRELYLQKITEMKTLKIEDSCLTVNPDVLRVFPEFDAAEENNNFAYASAKIKLSYDTKKGRHVLAQKPICKGDILFIEKAFAIAPVFTNDNDIYPFKCYNCLKDVISSIPCSSCTVCVYCNETCRQISWQDCHKWECMGMQAGIWYHLGIAFPGFRSLIKGVRSGFQVIKGTPEEDAKNFGDKNDNYPYFNRLMSHIYKNKNASPYLLMAAVVVRYLCKYTEFFPWLLTQENCPKDELDALVNYVGGLLTKHIGQLSCNSSVIEHCTPTKAENIFPDKVSVACGIFPSVSMMNHSCKANITSFFICDTIIVKAAEDLPIGQEVFNCYGIDYRKLDRRQRQQACRSLYFFECKCVICTNPLREQVNMV